jgi:hypothetical protein
VDEPTQVSLDQTRTTVADQQSLEDTVAAHCGEVVGEQQRRIRRVHVAVERDDHARVACHGRRAYRRGP